MNFRTSLPPLEADFTITHQDALLSIGSCFTKHIGNRLIDLKFNNLLNPFGIIFNPISLSNALHYLLSDRTFTEDDLFYHHEQWRSFMHHSCFSGMDKIATLDHMNLSLHEARTHLKQVNRLLITLGTANVFIYKKTGEIVANHHKLPIQDFERRRLHIRDIAEAFEPLFRELKRQTPGLHIIMTVSPVRHIRDGLIENQRSKAALLIALEHLVRDLDYVHYFPSYEYMMDDLRDYRFYESDMIHPNEQAIAYIWERFSDAFFDAKTRELNQRIDDIIRASRHRPFHPRSQQHRAFLRQQLEKIAALERAYPDLNFRRERQAFERQMV